ncbi:MAG: hypothetical protein CENE_03797 [Candidatus Celerinatantimonas neptuna]|nr:MAG: hypothetical protein CENE_03797 [Candidatus Celerinatantimonas neptuna]
MTDEELQAMDFRCYVTAAGFNYEATAKALSKTVNIKYIQLDRGMLPAEQSPINLAKMVDSYGAQGRFNASVTEDPDNPGGFIVSCNIPADHSIDGKGYVIKGAAAVLDNGIIYAYRRVESDYKVVGQGSAKSYIIRLRFLPANADVIHFTIDPSVVLVTQADLADQKKILIAADANVLQQAKDYADAQDSDLKEYVNNQDAATLKSAKSYADSQDNDLKTYVASAIPSAWDDAFSNPGYRINPDGYIEQFGMYSYDAKTGKNGTLITLPIAMPNAILAILATDSNAGVNSVSGFPIDKQTIRVWGRAGGTGIFADTKFFMKVIGY